MRICKQARSSTSSAAVCRPQRRKTTKAHDKIVPEGAAASYEGVIRRVLGAKGSGNRSWRSQDIPGRLSVEAGSSVGAGVGRWWRAATGCDPSALTRRALKAGSFWQKWALAAGQLPRAGQRSPRCAPPVGRAWGSYGLRRRCCQDRIDCLIAHLSADGETRNPRPNMACNKNS